MLNPDKIYFTNNPCQNGHTAARWKSTDTCVVCWELSIAKARIKELQQRLSSPKNKQDKYEKERNSQLKKLYGITLNDFNQMILQQEGKCLICLEEKSLVVDHCHVARRVRGLLCQNCNTALGHFKESEVVLERAIKYINEFKIKFNI